MRLSASLMCLACLLGSSLSAALAAELPPAPWVADQGDGTYKNPILFADYSDPDVVRVGDDYWLVSSSFNHAPALPILHSRDLVNWTIVNHALPAQVPFDHFNVPRHGEGVWAPAIRFHKDKYYIFYPDPDFGLYVITATDPRGRWSDPVLIKGGKGLIDPCPFWDDDGKAYMVHGWAKSRAGISNQLTLHRLNDAITKVTDEGKVIIDANKIEGWRTLEGPKLYKHGEYYYVFAPAGGVTEGYQAVFRTKDLYGEWERRIVLEQGHTPTNGPHQGAWVDTPKGEHWFLHFQDRGPFGRVTVLEPMSWGEDGWPRMGTAVKTGAETGNPVLTYKKPDLPKQAIAVPETSDEFSTPALGAQWQWEANPKPEFFSLWEKPDSLRLYCRAEPEANSLYNAPHLLLQKFPAPAFTAVTKVTLAAAREGDEAGLIVFGFSYSWIGLRKNAQGCSLVQIVHKDAQKNGKPAIAQTVASVPETVWLRVIVANDGKCRFAYSADGKEFTDFGEVLQSTVGRWVGAKVGIFAATEAGATSKGHADFEWFHVMP